MKSRVLLLGGNGFIGQALAPLLKLSGREVVVAGRHENLNASLADCGAVVHLACSTTPGLSRHAPQMERENLDVTLRLLDALKERPGVQVVFLSSGGAIYGNPDVLPVSEDAPLRPLSWHAAAKAAVEALLRAHASGAVTILRVSNAYAPSQPEKPGFGFIRTVLDSVRRSRPVEIWGDGENLRDFVYVDDVARAVIAALDHPECPGTFNVGSGRGVSLNQIVDMAGRISGKQVRVERLPFRDTDVRSVVLDISRIRQVLGWSPMVSFEQGLWETWRGAPELPR